MCVGVWMYVIKIAIMSFEAYFNVVHLICTYLPYKKLNSRQRFLSEFEIIKSNVLLWVCIWSNLIDIVIIMNNIKFIFARLEIYFSLVISD